jgi:aspartate/methionine/tyrosine aminotransferase
MFLAPNFKTLQKLPLFFLLIFHNMLFYLLGAYSDSRGLPGIRKEVADFIERRDGYPT